MNKLIDLIEKVGTQEDGTLATGTTTKLFTSGQSAGRIGIRVKNHDASAYFYISYADASVAFGSVTPTSTSHMDYLGPGQTLTVAIGPQVAAFLRSSTSTPAYSAQEVF